MTRETKIGLLVGLAFVIVIGILISDHLSTTNEPPNAPLRLTADNVRSSLGQQSSDDVAPPLRVPTVIAPVQPVPTREELIAQSQSQRTQSQRSQSQRNQSQAQNNNEPPVHFVDPPTARTDVIQPENPPLQNQSGDDQLHQIAREHNEELVDPNAGSGSPQRGANPSEPTNPTRPAVASRTYVAQPGDTLASIARKAYGSGGRANRQLIVAANPDLAENRDLIIAGREYVIPPQKGAAPSAANTAPATPTTRKPATAAAVYTVKPHDTLWSIATTQLGSASAIAAIRDLNQDVLDGSDNVRPNMKLRLPPRTAVSAND